MTVLSELTELLRRWDVWKRVEEAPNRIDALEQRIGELESRLKRAPGEACPRCGMLDYRVQSAEEHPLLGPAGGRIHHMKCGACNFTDEKTV